MIPAPTLRVINHSVVVQFFFFFFFFFWILCCFTYQTPIFLFNTSCSSDLFFLAIFLFFNKKKAILFRQCVECWFILSAELLSYIRREAEAGRLPSNVAAGMEELYQNYKNAVKVPSLLVFPLDKFIRCIILFDECYSLTCGNFSWIVQCFRSIKFTCFIRLFILIVAFDLFLGFICSILSNILINF